MSVCIKGVDPPSNCWECGTYGIEYYKHTDCPITNGKIDINQYKNDRPEDCPVIGIPKEVRLIDANRLKADNPKHMNQDVPYVTEVTVEEIIDNAPTVIEEDRKWVF